MSKTTRFMVYSAITADQAQQQFEADAARARNEGYEPVAETWDGTTLTVTYHLRRDRSVEAPSVNGAATQGGASFASSLERWPAVALGALLLVSIVMIGSVVLLNVL